MRYAVIASGNVENVIEAPQEFALPAKTLVALQPHQSVGPGDLWDGEAFRKPTPPTSWQMPASEFQTLLTDDELTAIQLSVDPNVIRLRTWIQTIRDDVQSEDVRLIGGINYLAYVAGLLTTPRAARILAGQEPE